MKYKIDRILRDLRIHLRQNPAAPAQLLGSAQLSLDQWIESRLPAAVEAEHLLADVSDFDTPQPFNGRVEWTRPDIASGTVRLPADFLRLVAFLMSDWAVAATSTITPGAKEYMRQNSPHAGVRGNPDRPVCALAADGEGRALEFYSCLSTDAAIVQALYIPAPAIASDGTIDIAPPRYQAVLARLAAEFC